MAVKTIYPLGTAAPTPNFFGVTSESIPSAANSTYGWTVAKTAITSAFWRSRLGASATASVASATSLIAATSGPTKGTGATNSTAGDSFIAGPYYGTFANTNWTFAWNMRAGVAGAIGRIRMRVWKSLNADGSSPTELTGSVQVGSIVTLSTTVDANSAITWTPGGTFTLTEEYLFFQVEWEETTAGSSNTDTVLFRLSTAAITTPDFTASAVVIWNPQDKDSHVTLSGANLIATLNTNAGGVSDWCARASHAKAAGYFEISSITGTTLGVGIMNTTASLATFVGADTNGWGYTASGKITNAGGFVATGLATWTAGDTVGAELTASVIKFYKNGALIYTTASIPTGSLFPCIDYGGSINDVSTANFGATTMSFLPVGILSWDGTQTGAVIYTFPRSRKYVRR